MASTQDKQITVPVPEDRVAEFYLWFGQFLAAEAGGPPRRGGPPGPPWGGRGRGRAMFMHGPQHEASPWTEQDSEQAAWLYAKLAAPARQLFDLLIDAPGERFSGNDIATQLELERGAHGVAGLLAWPGRYCRKLGRELPISTDGRDDGGTDYYMDPATAKLFAAARHGA